MQFLYHIRHAAGPFALPAQPAERRNTGTIRCRGGYCVFPFFFMISSYLIAHCLAFSSYRMAWLQSFIP
jgi:hypothetical protein